MKVIAVIEDLHEIRRILRHLFKIAGGGAPLRRPALASRAKCSVYELNYFSSPSAGTVCPALHRFPPNPPFNP